MVNRKICTYAGVCIALFSLIAGVDAAEKKSLFSFSIFGGPQYGGINEEQELDAVTSATKFGGKTGIRIELKIKRRFIIETGLEYLSFNQDLTYLDASENYNGTWKLSLQQLRIPLTYNIHLRENRQHDPLIILRFGPYLGFLVSDKTKNTGTVPEYTTKSAEGGLVIAGLICPFTIGKHVSTGIFLDMQRGVSIFWEDPYNKGEGFGVSRTSVMSFGLLLRFCNF